MERRFDRMIIFKAGEQRMKGKYQICVLAVMVAAALLLQLVTTKDRADRKEQYSVRKTWEEPEESSTKETKESEEDTWMTESAIRELKNQPEDNEQDDRKAEMDVTITGYAEHPVEFGWMNVQEWERFQEELKKYLQKKGLLDVTEAHLHPDTIQKINDFERYVYLDVNHSNDYTDRLIIKAACDTYTDTMRFAFEIQYGS